MVTFDFKNPIAPDSSLMLDHKGWGWDQPSEVVVFEQIANVKEVIPAFFAMQNIQEPKVRDVNQPISRAEEVTIKDLVSQNDKQPPKVHEAKRNLEEPEIQFEVPKPSSEIPEANHDNPKKRRGRPKGSTRAAQNPKEQQHSTKRSRRSVSSNFTLASGWIIEEHVREKGKTAGRKDKTYREPGTGRRFRSRPEVEEHLERSKKNQEENEPGMRQLAAQLDVE